MNTTLDRKSCRGSWRVLPFELMTMIIEMLTWPGASLTSAHEQTALAPYSNVSRQWQSLVEPVQFKLLILDVPDILDFGKIVIGPRMAYVQHIWLRLELPTYDCQSCQTEESKDEIQSHNLTYTNAICDLFEILSSPSWHNTGGITLELSAHSPSDMTHFGKDLKMRISDTAWEKGDEGPDRPPILTHSDPLHGWLHGRKCRLTLPAGAKHRLFGHAHGLGFDRDAASVRRMDRNCPRSALSVASSSDVSSIGRSAPAGAWQEYFAVCRDWKALHTSRGAALLATFVGPMASLLPRTRPTRRMLSCCTERGPASPGIPTTSICSARCWEADLVSEGSPSSRTSTMCSMRPLHDPGPHPSSITLQVLWLVISQGRVETLRSCTRRRTSTPRAFSALARTLGGDPSEFSGWKDLKYLPLTCMHVVGSVLVANGDDTVIRLAATRAELMPQLEIMELWGRWGPGTASIFRFERRGRRPKIQLLSTEFGHISKQETACWQGVVDRLYPGLGIRLEVEVTRLDGNTILGLIELLVLKDRILHPIYLSSKCTKRIGADKSPTDGVPRIIDITRLQFS